MSTDYTFKEWIECFKNVDLPIGDISRDMLGDEDFPDSDDYIEIFEYIVHKSHRNSDIVEAFRTVWDFYKASAF